MSEDEEKRSGTKTMVDEKPKRKLLIVLTLVIVAILLVAFIFIAFFNNSSPIVGKWHFTKVKEILHSENITHPIDDYLVFNASGTGYASSSDPVFGTRTHFFVWEDLGHNRLKITSGGNSMVYLYIVQGDKIQLEYIDSQGNKYIIYGERVQSIPPPQGGILFGSLIFNEETSDLSKGWINMTLNLTHPESMVPSDISLLVNDTPLRYVDKITGDKQWSFLDLDGDGKVSNGDIIEIHYTGAKSGDAIILTCKGYSGDIEAQIYKGVLYGSLRYDAGSSNIAAGWVNLTIYLTNPDYLNPPYVHITIENLGELNYAKEITGDGQWSFVDLDGTGTITSGDKIVIHSISISDGDTIILTYDFYQASFEVTIP